MLAGKGRIRSADWLPDDEKEGRGRLLDVRSSEIRAIAYPIIL